MQDDHHEVDDDGMAQAAQAAADAMNADDRASLVCRICGLDDRNGRPLLRFLPVHHDAAAAAAAPSVVTFGEDVCLHIFCGKTASILPTVNQPHLEILTKAGLKNKHGIGPEVNAALARTRSASVEQEGQKEKLYYLVREFEAHLAAIRHTSITFSDTAEPPNGFTEYELDHLSSEGDELVPPSTPPEKLRPTRAAAGAYRKPARYPKSSLLPPPPTLESEVDDEGKVRCGCGGTHLPLGTSRGVQSWRSHVMTKRHQKWMEENGQLGQV